ncbi:Cupin 1 [Dillenia turbinata]|uniref:Cupin 1 n=1 Tax=Dillenia turbinata TaxID=194707 RepID=A0AAN8UWG1_9MAGN
MKKSSQLPLLLLFLFFFISSSPFKVEEEEDVSRVGKGIVVKKCQRKSLVSTEFGEISAVDIKDKNRGAYHLRFITLEPNSLFLPVLLHADMVFYVQTGSGRLSWVDEDEMRRVRLRRGDVYRLRPGTIFFVESSLQPQREKLRIHAIFAYSGLSYHIINNMVMQEKSIGAYSSINDLLLGFDPVILRSAFQVTEGVVESVMRREKPPAIVHGAPKTTRNFWEWEAHFMKLFIKRAGHSMYYLENKLKKSRAFNVQDAHKDVENSNGWSLTVTWKNLQALRGSDIGFFMVNLTKGAMMGPHWNSMATEISVVLEGRGMVQVVCPSSANKSECQDQKLRVEEGDVFAVPRLHPMAQMSFNNDSFAFLGFSTTWKMNYPQFLAGKASVFQALDKNVLAAAFNAGNSTIDQLLSRQAESVILKCISCAEELERK